MKSKKMWIAFVLVFLSGIAIGLVAGMLVKKTPQKRSEQKHHGMMKMRLLRHMSKELNLTSDQKKNVDTILISMTKDISAYQTEQRPKIQSIIESAFAEIDKILTVDQKTKMLKLQKRMPKFRRKHNDRERRENGKFGSPQRREGGREFRGQDGDRFYGGNRHKKSENYERKQRRPPMPPNKREGDIRRHRDGKKSNRTPGEKSSVPPPE